MDFLLVCEAEALVATGRELAGLLGARLVYDVHDDAAAVAASHGEPPDVVGRYEVTQRAALRIADHVIVSTRNEAGMAATAQVALARTALLPNGADPQQRTCWGPKVEVATLVFLGNLYYEPNARAVAAIRTMVLPALHAAGINDALRGVTLGLAPLTAGSGAKMKVLDYLAAGLPVLGTSEAVTGLPPDHPGVLVENDLRGWPSLLAALLRDPTALREIGRGGRQCVERDLSWRQIGTDLLRHTHKWLTTTTEPGRPCWLRRAPRDTCMAMRGEA